MKLIRLSVKGEYGCHYDFTERNVILGDNNSGKSTFLKLILYCLGAPIKTFIDEISKMNWCDSVSLDIEFKNGKKARILRKLPASDAIVVTPIKNNEDLVNDEINALSVQEFSDYLLDSEGYARDKITYSKDKTATFRFYFLLRAIYVDQDTQAQSILSDLDMGRDYFTSQPIIKKTIIEKLLGKDNSELQRIRLEIQALTRAQTEMSDRISFLTEEQGEIQSQYELLPSKVRQELEDISAEKKILSQQEYKKIAAVKAVNDTQNVELRINLQHKLNGLYEQLRTLTLEIKDVDEVIESLNEDLTLLKYKVAAKDILEEMPILFCPNCLSPLPKEKVNEGLCDNCHKKTIEEQIINSATLKKTIADSILEAQEIKQVKNNELAAVKHKIDSIQRELRDLQIQELEKREEENNLIYQAIAEIKKRLEHLLQREHILKRYLSVTKELEKLKSQRKNNSSKLTELKDELLKADTQAALSMQHYSQFIKNFRKYLNAMFDEVAVCELDENYMPVIDNTKMSAVSSASLKVAIRLAYVLALLNESIGSDVETSHLGFLLLDSPKDKDLDNYRFDKYLQMIDSECCGQIIVTGSLSDEELYKNNLKQAKYFEPLRTNAKLLKKQEPTITLSEPNP